MKQTNFWKKPKETHGGAKAKGKRKTARILLTKQPMRWKSSCTTRRNASTCPSTCMDYFFKNDLEGAGMSREDVQDWQVFSKWVWAS